MGTQVERVLLEEIENLQQQVKQLDDEKQAAEERLKTVSSILNQYRALEGDKAVTMVRRSPLPPPPPPPPTKSRAELVAESITKMPTESEFTAKDVYEQLPAGVADYSAVRPTIVQTLRRQMATGSVENVGRGLYKRPTNE